MTIKDYNSINNLFNNFNKNSTYNNAINLLIKVDYIIDKIYKKTNSIIYLNKETGLHSLKVAQLATLTGLSLNLNKKDLEELIQGAILHDIGKLFIPKSVLSNPGKLSKEEMKIMREHTNLGYKLVSSLNTPHSVKLVVIDHHERIDGSGYNNKKGKEISYFAKIVAICDVFEAFSAKRCYKPAEETNIVIDFLNTRKNIDFDEEIVNIFNDKVYSIIQIIGGLELTLDIKFEGLN